LIVLAHLSIALPKLPQRIRVRAIAASDRVQPVEMTAQLGSRDVGDAPQSGRSGDGEGAIER